MSDADAPDDDLEVDRLAAGAPIASTLVDDPEEEETVVAGADVEMGDLAAGAPVAATLVDDEESDPDGISPTLPLGDEGVPSTARDEALAAKLDPVEDTADDTEDDDPDSEDAPGGGSGLVVKLVLALLCLLIGGGAAYWMQRDLLAPPPTAAAHVPIGANIVARADAVKLGAYPPVRKHLWPLALGRGPDQPRAKRIREATGVSFPFDVREVVVASVEGKAWVMIVAGRFEPGRFIPGLAKVIEDEKLKSWKHEPPLLIHEGGLVVGQADDGVIVLGTSREVLMTALPASEPEDAPTMPEGAIAFDVNPRATEAALAEIPLDWPEREPLANVTHIDGRLELAKAPRWRVFIHHGDGDDKAPAVAVGQLMARAKRSWPTMPAPIRDAFGRAKTRSEKGRIVVEVTWRADEVDTAAATLARLLSGEAAALPSAAPLPSAPIPSAPVPSAKP